MYTVTIRGAKETADHLYQLSVKFPKALNKESKEIMHEFKGSLRNKAPKWHGILRQSIRIHKQPKGYYITMRDYGRMLDQMPTHKVRWFGRPVLKEWIEESKPLFPGSGYQGKGLITVEATPWITPAIDEVRPRIKERFNAMVKYYKNKVW